MNLSPELVAAFKKILSTPSEHGLDIKPLKECFSKSDVVIPKHILFNEFIEYIKKPLPKVIFYIIMDEEYGKSIGKATNGDIGYYLSLNKEQTLHQSVATM